MVGLLLLLHGAVAGQHQKKLDYPLRIKSLGTGGRLFELNSIGNNPKNLGYLLKDPGPYLDFINSQSFNSLYSNPGIQFIYHYHLLAEFKKDNPSSRFWKKYSLQSGLVLTSKLKKSGMSIGNQGHLADSTMYFDHYSFTQEQRFLGAQFGLNRRIRLSHRVQFFTGLQLLGSVAVMHRYGQQRDSNTFHHRRGWTYQTTELPKLKGKNYTQWQAMLPLALEIDIYKKKLYLRPELFAGIIGGKYWKLYRGGMEEAHGLGLSLIYSCLTY